MLIIIFVKVLKLVCRWMVELLCNDWLVSTGIQQRRFMLRVSSLRSLISLVNSSLMWVSIILWQALINFFLSFCFYLLFYDDTWKYIISFHLYGHMYFICIRKYVWWHGLCLPDWLTSYIYYQLEQKQKYAAWKAADIRKALKEGRKPIPGPPGDEGDTSEFTSVPSNTYVGSMLVVICCLVYYSFSKSFRRQSSYGHMLQQQHN